MVALAHEVLIHIVSPILVLGVTALDAKLVPINVTDDWPLVAMFFGSTCEIRGASNEKISPCGDAGAVLAICDIVSARNLVFPNPVGLRHVTAVLEVNMVDAQTVEPSRTVPEVSTLPKFNPYTVMEAFEVVIPLKRCMYVSTGAS
jgi:hypothetical protein